MPIVLTGYRLHDKRAKEARTIIARPGNQQEDEFRADIRAGKFTGDQPYKGKLTPQYGGH